MSDTKQIPMYQVRLIAHLSEALRHIAEGHPKNQLLHDLKWALKCLEESKEEMPEWYMADSESAYL